MEIADPRPAVEAELVLGRYRLGRRLGAGGFGVVYEAFDERLERWVAVKVIPAGSQTPARAAREALAAARLDHPVIVAVHDAGEEPGARYLVSELVHGRTLAELEAEGKLSDRDVVRVGLALADGLMHAHERGVVHRDLKPQNVMVPDRQLPAGTGALQPPRAVAKLMDFGVAHLVDDDALTHTGDIVGTLAYMAPEQAEGRRVDARTDLYALGLVLYEALAGTHPVRGASPAATARRLGTVLPALRRARPELPTGLTAAVDRAVRPRPAERGTIAELADALLDVLAVVPDEGGAVARHPLEGPVRWPAPRPLARRAAAACAAGVLAAGALGWLAPAGAMLGIDPGVAGAAAAALVFLAPRLGWMAAAAALVAVLTGPAPGGAVVLAAAALPTLILVRAPVALSLPALAAGLGVAGLAGAFPALAGRAGRLRDRAALGALGAWWLILAEVASGRTLLLGPVVRPAGWQTDGAGVADALVAVVLDLRALGLCALWALGSAVLPALVRGRHAGLDWLAAIGWAAALAAATGAGAELSGDLEPSNLAVCAQVAALLAVGGSRVGAPRSSHTGLMEPSTGERRGGTA